MSFQSAEPHLHDASVTGPTEPPSKGTYRSYKKKFNKIKLLFDDAMKDSDKLFKDEQKVVDILRRFQEQNDHITDFLLDLNHYPRISPNQRHKLGALNTAVSHASLRSGIEEHGPEYKSEDVPSALETLRELQKDLRSGEISRDDFDRMEHEILLSAAFAPNKSLAALEQVPHTAPDSTTTIDADHELLRGLLEEDSYSLQLDSLLGEPSGTQDNSHVNPPTRLSDKTADKERDLALRNPVSVYNWLRKHQPQVFLQDNEATSEKASGKSGNPRGTKRNSAVTKQDEEPYDEDGILIEKAGGGRGKRKRDDEPYRPKGGSSRSTKRKREDAQPSKRGKKNSISENVF